MSREEKTLSIAEVEHEILSANEPTPPERVLTFRFLRLPFVQRMQVLEAVGLLEEDDAKLAEEELWKRAFRRSKEKKRLADLWDEVNRRTDLPPIAVSDQNPFAGR